jgi:hypothetical protein
VKFDPAVMDQFGGGESLDALNTVGFGDDDLITGTVGFGTHLALDRLGSALEKIEHAAIIARRGSPEMFGQGHRLL